MKRTALISAAVAVLMINVGPTETSAQPEIQPAPVTRPTLPPDASPGTSEAPAPRVYVALGDSYAAGEGAPTNVIDSAGQNRELFLEGTSDPGNHCHRSLEAYPVKLWERLDRDDPSWGMKFVACSGAITASLDNTQTSPSNDNKVPPQYDAFIEHPKVDLITMTMGGNNLQFAKIVRDCTVSAAYCPTKWNRYLSDKLVDLRRELAEDYTRLKSHLKDGGQLVVLGYPRPYPEKPPNWCGNDNGGVVSKRAMNWINRDVADRVNQVIREEAGRAGATYVDVADLYTASGRHDACLNNDGERWINRIKLRHQEWSFHPRPAAHAAITNRIKACLEDANICG